MTRQVQVSAGGVFDLEHFLVWCPRYRRLVLGGLVAGWCAELIGAKADRHGWQMVALESTPNHVHLLVTTHLSGSSSLIARQVKGLTSWRRAQLPHRRSRQLARWSYVAVMVAAVPSQTIWQYGGSRNERRRWKERAR